MERKRVLTRITKALERSGITLHPGGLGGTPGAATFAAALQAVPRTRFRKLSMVRSDLTARGAALLAGRPRECTQLNSVTGLPEPITKHRPKSGQTKVRTLLSPGLSTIIKLPCLIC